MSIGENNKVKFVEPLKKLEDAGWDLYATEGTHPFLSQVGIASRCIYKASEKIEPNVSTLISNRAVDLIINIPKEGGLNTKSDGFTIRRLSIDHHIPLISLTCGSLTHPRRFLEKICKHLNEWLKRKKS